MERPTRVLLVDDYAPFRHYVSLTLQKQPELHIVGEASDGLEAVQKVQELKPDLILIDIGLPGLNGIEATRRIRTLTPESTILILSENRSWNVAEDALRSGASGYVVKSDAALELLLAVKSVLEGTRFVSSSLAARDLTEPKDTRLIRQHEAGFYSDDRWLLEDVTQFIGAALIAGSAAIVVATEPHRNFLQRSLGTLGLDIGLAIEQGRYIALDADETLSRIMLNGLPDRVRFLTAFDDLFQRATNAVKRLSSRVAVFGECVHLLCAQGNTEAAIQMEKLGNQLVDKYDMDILCGYCVNSLKGVMNEHIYERIQAEHSAFHYR